MMLDKSEEERIFALSVGDFDRELQAAGYKAELDDASYLTAPQLPVALATVPEGTTPARAIFNAWLFGHGPGRPREFLRYLMDNLRYRRGL